MPEVDNVRLKFRLFGPFDARLDGKPLSGLSENRRAAHLLAFLALHFPRVMDRDWVTDQLSAEDAGGNRTEFSGENLRHQVMNVRRMLADAAPVLVSANRTLSLNGDAIFVDTCAFDSIWEARQEDPRSLERLVEIYQGPLLLDWNEAWIRPKRDGYARNYLNSLRALARQAVEDGNIEVAIDYLARAAEADPASQQTQIRLMETLLNTGEHLKAKEAFQRHCDILREQGLPLSKEMVDLFKRIPRSVPGAVSVPDSSSLEIEPPSGAVPIRSRYYIVRASDGKCHDAITRRDSFVLLHGSRQVGKTSILARGLEQGRRMGAQTLHTDFQKFSEPEMASLDTFFLSLAQRISKSLNLPNSPRDTWEPDLAPGMNFEQFLMESVLERVSVPVVWGLDEVDRLFACDYRGDVFGVFRSWHNERALSPDSPLERLTILFSYAIEAHRFIPNLNQSPFNVGTSIPLADFSPHEVEELSGLHDVPSGEAASLFRLTDGHPYLTRSALHAMNTRKMTLSEMEMQADREDGPFGGHLRHLRRTLAANEILQNVVRGLLRGEACSSLDAYYHLVAAGILKGEAPEATRFRCSLYETYLRKVLQ